MNSIIMRKIRQIFAGGSFTSPFFQLFYHIESTLIIIFYSLCYLFPEVCNVLRQWLPIIKSSGINFVHPSFIAGEVHTVSA